MRWLALVAIVACGRADFDFIGDAARVANDGPAGDTSALDPSLVAWWRMESLDSIGGMLGVVDSSGVTGSYAECNGSTCPTIVAGKIGNAAQFDGVDDLLVAASASALIDNNYTIGAWVEIDAAPTSASCSMTKALGSAQFNSWSACFYASLAPYFYTASGSTPDSIDGPEPLSLNAWHYVALVWDGSTKTLWVDGAVQGTDVPSGVDFDSDPVYIGGDADSGMPTAFLTGLVDEVRVYNRALAPSEIATLSAQ